MQVEGTFRAHQVPLAGGPREPRAPGDARGVDAQLPARGALRRRRPARRLELAALAPEGDKRMGATPHANGGRRLVPLEIPDPARPTRSSREAGGRARANRRSASASCCATSTRPTPNRRTSGSSVPTRPTPTGSARSSRSSDRCLMDARPDDEHVSPEGRVMEVLSEHNCQGWLEGYLLTGRHGLFATYEAFAMVSASMAIQHTKWLEEAAAPRRGERRSPRSTSCSPPPAGATTTTASATRARA